MTIAAGSEPIAILGMSGRFPGARDVDELWHNLSDGIEAITRFTREDLLAAGIPNSIIERKDHVPVGAVLEDIDLFDAAFFGYSPREAELIDPQQRLFLECAWEALESAGYSGESNTDRIGVFAGGHNSTYMTNNLLNRPELTDGTSGIRLVFGNHLDYLATRVSHRLDLTGPSFTVATACSTSLVAVVLACQSLLDRQCGIALAGGVTVRVPQSMGYFYKEGEIFSQDGHCRTFDAAASGTVFGNGVGVIALKRLDDAQRDGDSVLAVIRGAALNNDGANKAAFTAPNLDGQYDVIAEALALSGVDPATIGYVEAHGTATRLGDPIEVAALAKAYGQSLRPRIIGSAKECVGHLNAAAGITGLIKVVQMLRHRELPPSVHFTTPNPNIDWGSGVFAVNSERKPWIPVGEKLRAGVSSFGVGGTNAHVVLEEAPTPERATAECGVEILPLSAKTAIALDAVRARLIEHLEAASDDSIADVAFTLQEGRSVFAYRHAVVVRSAKEAVLELRASDPAARAGKADVSRTPVMLFPGQGAQFSGMAAELYHDQLGFRREFDRCAEILAHRLPFDLAAVIFGGAADAELLADTRFSQSALFSISYALARNWMNLGVMPTALVGHSVGEFVAACLSGVLSLEDALTVIAERGQLMHDLPSGAMLAVMAPEQDLLALLGGDVDLAAVNARDACVVSGPSSSIERFEASLGSKGIATSRLRTSRAFHSAMMDSAIEPFSEILTRVCLNPPRIPIISSVTGAMLTEREAMDPAYWANHLRRPVRFADALQTLIRTHANMLCLECGPGTTLGSLARRQFAERDDVEIIASIPGPHDRSLARTGFLKAVGRAWELGIDIRWAEIRREGRRRRVGLPTYPFERQRYWIDAKDGTEPSYQSLVAARNSAGTPGTLKHMYSLSWRRAPLPRQAATEGGTGSAPWLAFTDNSSKSEAAAVALETSGRPLVRVYPGQSYERAGASSFRVPPGDGASLKRLLETLEAEGQLPDGVLHAWCLGRDPNPNMLAAASEAQERGPMTVFHVLKALGSRGTNMKWLVPISGAVGHAGELPRHPARATLLGACRAAAAEFASMTFRMMEIDQFASGETAAHAIVAEASALNADMSSRRSPNAVLALWRDGVRWTASLEAQSAPDLGLSSDRIKSGGTYLVTGGLGAIGARLAQRIAEHAPVNLVLVQRTRLPERSEWSSLLANPNRNSLNARLASVLELEAQGANIVIESADVADFDEMSAVISRSQRKFGRIDGVIHAAGVADGRLIQRRTEESVIRVLRPKVIGALVLDELLTDPLDFFVCCSSVAALLPPPGQIGYSAANAFLDAFCAHRSGTKGEFTLSINWDAWSGGGMATRATADLEDMASPSVLVREQPSLNPILGVMRRRDSGEVIYEAQLSGDEIWVLNEHRILSSPVLPGTGIVDALYAAARDVFDAGADVEITDLFLVDPLVVPPKTDMQVRTVLTPCENGFEVLVSSCATAAEMSWREHARARIARASTASSSRRIDIAAWSGAAPLIDHAALRAESRANRRTLEFGPRWDNIVELRCTPKASWIKMQLPPVFERDLATHKLHPAILDNALAMLSIFLERHASLLPFHYRRITVRRPLAASVVANIRLAGAAPHNATMTFDALIADPDGDVLVEIEGYTLKRVPDAVLRSAEAKANAVRASHTVRAFAPKSGRIEALRFTPVPRRTPRAGEVEVRIKAVGLNFKDVLSATGRLPSSDGSAAGLCLECAGEIVATGAGVDDLGEGDQVVAFGAGCLAGFVTLPSRLCRRRPPGLSAEQAASVPVALATAYHALVDRARISDGESVLIHAASGGVGLAAINLARRAGATVFATAGTEAKRAYLRQLGVEHVMDSRSLAFADEVLELTEGRGVDIVLNSLAGEFLQRSLGLLAPYGRFLELGVRDILLNSNLGLRVFSKGGAFIPIMLNPGMPRFNEIFDAVIHLVTAGDLPPLPITVAPFSKAREVFASMSAATHIGKLVLRNDDEPLKRLNAGSEEDVPEGANAREPSADDAWQISPDEGAALFAQALRLDGCQVIISKRPLTDGLGISSQLTAKSRRALRPTHSRPELPVAYVPPQTATQERLATILSELLGIDPIGIHDDFSSLGGDSLIATQVIGRIRADFESDLPIGSLFEHPTVATLADLIEQSPQSRERAIGRGGEE